MLAVLEDCKPIAGYSLSEIEVVHAGVTPIGVLHISPKQALYLVRTHMVDDVQALKSKRQFRIRTGFAMY